MFRKSFQKGFLTVLYSGGSNPLGIWDRWVANGHIKRVTDEDVRTLVLEMRGTNVATCYIYTPIHPKEVLGISLPFFVMIVKNLKKYFSFEIQILDDRNMRRRFRVSNYQTTTKVRPFGTTMPIGLNPGWNQIQFNLADFTKRAYGSTYLETQRLQIHANCRIRRIYFCDRLYADEDLPNEYKLFYPCVEKKKKEEGIVKDVMAEVPPPSEAGDEVEQEEVEREGEEFLGMEGHSMEIEMIGVPEEEPPDETAPPPIPARPSATALAGDEALEEPDTVFEAEQQDIQDEVVTGDVDAAEAENVAAEEHSAEEPAEEEGGGD